MKIVAICKNEHGHVSQTAFYDKATLADIEDWVTKLDGNHVAKWSSLQLLPEMPLPVPKYMREINQILDSLYEDWMDDDDKREFRQQAFKLIGCNTQCLSDQIEEGVKNGYPASTQVELIKKLISSR